jgi:hypothetical protein
MRGKTKVADGAWQPESEQVEEGDITLPLRIIICAKKGGQRNARAYRLKMEAESARGRTPHWTEIGEPTE